MSNWAEKPVEFSVTNRDCRVNYPLAISPTGWCRLLFATAAVLGCAAPNRPGPRPATSAGSNVSSQASNSATAPATPFTRR